MGALSEQQPHEQIDHCSLRPIRVDVGALFEEFNRNIERVDDDNSLTKHAKLNDIA